jgi:hypothetical protein
MNKCIKCIGILLLILIACEKNKDTGNNLNPNVDEILSQLNSAYNSSSVSAFTDILINWHNQYTPKTISTATNEAEKAVYQIYQVFYDPFNIDKYGQHEWGNSMYAGCNYAIIQNRIYFNIGENEPDYTHCDSVNNFRPVINLPGKIALYLTDDYHAAIYAFLGSEYYPYGNEEYMGTEPVTEEAWDHYQFLNQVLYIIPGHWGPYWHVETHPYIQFITFDTGMQTAKIEFRIGYMFGEAVFEKNNTDWVMTSSIINAIE